MNRTALRTVIGIFGVLSLGVATRAAGVTIVVPDSVITIAQALELNDVTEVLVRSRVTEVGTVHMKSGVPVQWIHDDVYAPTIRVENAPAVIFPRIYDYQGTTLDGFDIVTTGTTAIVCDSVGTWNYPGQLLNCTITSADLGVRIYDEAMTISGCRFDCPHGIEVSADGTGLKTLI